MLVFAVIMDVALMGMVMSMAARRVPDTGPPLAVFAALNIVTLLVLGALLRRLQKERPVLTTR